MRVILRLLVLLLVAVLLNPLMLILAPAVTDFLQHIDLFEDDVAAQIWLWGMAIHVIAFLSLAGRLVVRRWTFNAMGFVAMSWCIYAILINARLQPLSEIGTFNAEPKPFAMFLMQEWHFAAVVLCSLVAGFALGRTIFRSERSAFK